MRHLRTLTGCLLTAAVVLAQGPAADAAAKFRQELDRTLAAHPFFAKVDFTIDASRPPFLFLVQRPPKDDPEYVRLVVNSYLPFLAELARVYDATYKQPLGLRQSTAMPTYAIAVLASEGNYHDFGRAVKERSLHLMRAHYDPTVRIAVTYQVAYGEGDAADERHALLHEFGHALQHAHSSTDEMTKPSWFNEGFADYRAASTHVASSLAEPPLQDNHRKALAFGYGNRAGRKIVSPLADLFAYESYGQVIEAAARRAGRQVTTELALGLFYAQSEMVVRFLHEAENGRYRPGFLRYMAAVQSGKAGLATFQTAFEMPGAALDELEQAWRRWLTDVLRQHNSRFPDLAAMTATNAANAPEAPAELPPPLPFDAASLAWQPAEVDARFAAARRLGSRGDYDGALLLLPGDQDGLDAAQQALRTREQTRFRALATLRDEVLTDLLRTKSAIAVRVADAECKGKLVRVEQDGIVLLVDRQERKVGKDGLRPSLLLKEGTRLKRLQGGQRWVEVWLRWLDGQSLASMKALFELGYPTIRDLRQDLQADFDAAYGGEALALVEMQRLPIPDDAAGARRSLAQLEALVKQHANSALLVSRKDAIDQLARALAERAFELGDAAIVGIRGAVDKLPDGRLRVRYADPAAVANADFQLDADAEEAKEIDIKLAYDGPTGVQPAGKSWNMIGSGALRWPIGLSGRQEIELEFCLRAAGFFVLMCCREDKGAISVAADGTLTIIDQTSQIVDQLGTGGDLMADKWHKLRVVHDGQKRVETFLDGRRIAEASQVGARVRGDVCLFVHSSNPIGLRNVSITGKLDPSDPLPVRERFVEAVLQRLWP